jgi:hypothetical protein
LGIYSVFRNWLPVTPGAGEAWRLGPSARLGRKSQVRGVATIGPEFRTDSMSGR